MIYPKAKIIGFEPDEKTFSVLEQNIHDNNFTNVTVYNKALLNKKGHISFFYDNDDSSIGSILGADSRKPNPLEKIVEADTLSSYINQPVDFLKMDVEGAETEIFEDLHKNNKLHFIKNIVMEFHHNISNSRNNLIKLLTILEQNNFGYIIENLNTLNAPQKLDPEKKNKLQGLFICACQNS
jgi:FkbM family methyltransferase